MNQNIDNRLNLSNRFDYLTILFIVLQIFGGLGGFFQPIRIFVFFAIISSLVSFTYNKNIFLYKYELLFFGFWLIYGFVSLTWTISPIEGLKELLILFFNFNCFFLLISLTNKANIPYNSIINGWTILFIITAPIALIEFFFDVHFSISKDSESQIIDLGFDTYKRIFASITYMNLNGYNTMLCYMLPFVMSNLLNKYSKIKSIIFWIIFLLITYIIVMNGSRAAFISLIISTVIFLFFYLKNLKLFFKIIISACVGILIINYFFLDVFKIIFLRLSEEGIDDGVRNNLISKGWDSFVESNFFGVGAGNFKSVMEYVYHQDLTSPHNFLLEIGVEYGILILIPFIGLFFRLYKKQKNNRSTQSKFIIMTALFTFPLLSIIDSSYLVSPYPWIYISSLLIIANKNKNI
jgi:hypothetical protein